MMARSSVDAAHAVCLFFSLRNDRNAIIMLVARPTYTYTILRMSYVRCADVVLVLRAQAL